MRMMLERSAPGTTRVASVAISSRIIESGPPRSTARLTVSMASIVVASKRTRARRAPRDAVDGHDRNARCPRARTYGARMPRLVDLSQEIYQGMPVYAGHLKTVIWQHHSHEDTAPQFDSDFSYQSLGLMLCDHGPTHVDALSHLDPS